MSRIKRWLNMHGKEFNANGTLKDEARQQMLSEGMNDAAINSYALRLKNNYNEWKRLDEADPEPWPVYTAYDFFTPTEQQQFNSDGTLKPEYIESELKKGISSKWLEEMERRKILEVENYNRVSALKAEMGINFGEQEMNRLRASDQTYTQRIKQMEVDLRNNEEPSTLPFDKDTSWF
ncbi:MAG TPA: hypothetical protein VE956_13375 [Nodularia sp. (in: cyanobacteria)]|nr:hypothetical protein [Nodularia sp. (in: cyanobacteria)]